MTVDTHSLVGAYVLDAVDDLERAAFTRHLTECEACAIEVAELREATAQLGDLFGGEPPSSLRDTVLAEVSQARQAGPEAPRPGASRTTSVRSAGGAPPWPRSRRRRSRWRGPGR